MKDESVKTGAQHGVDSMIDTKQVSKKDEVAGSDQPMVEE